MGLTAHAGGADRKRALELGFHGYIAKPVSPRSVVEQVERLLVSAPPAARPVEA